MEGGANETPATYVRGGGDILLDRSEVTEMSTEIKSTQKDQPAHEPASSTASNSAVIK